MNSILPSGVPRYNTGNLANNIKFDSQSVVIGEYAGKDLVLGEQNFYNTLLGYRAGQNSVDIVDNIFIGAETGINIYSGSNNILIGRESTDGMLGASYNALSLGYFNKLSTNSIFIGSYNESIGFQNIFLGIANSVSGDENIVLGNNNILNNSDQIICIGNNNFTVSSNVIIIGNSLYHHNATINIGDTFLRYDTYMSYDMSNYDMSNIYSDSNINLNSNLSNSNIIITNVTSNIASTIFIGCSDVRTRVVTGFTEPIHFETSNHHSLLSKNGIITDRITIGNFVTTSSCNLIISMTSLPYISLVCSCNLKDNIEYVLPELPDRSLNNVALSLNDKNEMIWKKLSMNTDEIMQGTSNIYYDANLVDARVEANFHNKFDMYFEDSYEKRIPLLSVDRLKNGTSNKMIVDGHYDGDISVSGKLFANHLIVNKIEVLGYGNNYQNVISPIGGYSSDDVSKIVTDTSNNLVNIINGLIHRIQQLEARVI